MTAEQLRKLHNSKGKIFYGMHFYPGVARYEPPGQEPFTVLVNESVIRKMGPTFAGRPIFVQHIQDDVEPNIDELRKEADGWVVESFFNQADGKTWAKFILVTERAFDAIEQGWRLSNAYIPICTENAGTWNGVPYEREVVDGEFEHLAIVQNPRYEESVIMTPEQFKAYNEKHTVELKRLANSKDKGDKAMGKFNLFKRAKVENAADLEGVMVELPKSKKEISIANMIEEYDKIMNMHGYANGDHLVKVGDKDEMSVNDLVKKHLEMSNEMSEMKKSKEEEGVDNAGDEEDDESMDNDDADVREGAKDVGDRGGDESVDNEEDGEDSEQKVTKKAKAENEKEKKAKEAKEKALRLKNAHLRNATRDEATATLDLPSDRVARGKALYGTGK